jgi:uncharacterized protein (DUF697 family)/tellurite resistance protein
MNPELSPEQIRALTSISTFAAFADGSKSNAEREKIKEVAQAVGDENVTQAIGRVLLGQTTIEAEAGALGTAEMKNLAWECALSVCESDGVTSAQEKAFLNNLAGLLGRPAALAAQDIAAADAVASAGPEVAASSVLAAVPVAAGVASGVGAVDARGGQVDSTVLKYAITTAAVDLLPQGLASMAIIPLQTKMVHSIAGVYGFTMSAAMIKEFLATIGIGAAGQMVESYARKFLGQLAGKYLGKSAKTAVNWSTGPIMTFATTYALGKVAQQYYAGGRTLSAVNMKSLFSQQVEQAKGLYAKYEPTIKETAAKTSPTQLLQTLRG